MLFTGPLVIAVISSAANFDSLDCLAAVYGDDRPAALSYDQVLLAGTNVHLYVPHRRAIDSASGERRAEKLSPNDLSPTEVCRAALRSALLRFAFMRLALRFAPASFAPVSFAL